MGFEEGIQFKCKKHQIPKQVHFTSSIAPLPILGECLSCEKEKLQGLYFGDPQGTFGDPQGTFGEIKAVPDEQKSMNKEERKPVLPSDKEERKRIPLGTGVLDYFPAALAEVAKVSFQGNQQHNAGEALHWARGKSADHADTIIRHFLERGSLDSDGMRHSAKLAWRVLALLQLELEAEGAPIARGVKE